METGGSVDSSKLIYIFLLYMSCVQLTDAQKKKNIYKNTASKRSKAMEFSHIMRNTKFDLTRKNVNCIPIEYIYVIGGINNLGGLDSIERYDGNKWELLSITLPFKLYDATASIYNNKVYIIGGINGNTMQINDKVLIFDGESVIIDQMLLYGKFGLTSVVYNDELYTIGGANTPINANLNASEKYNGTSWTAINNLITRRGSHSSIVYNNRIYSICGFKHGTFSTYINNVEYYDGLNWNIGPSFPVDCGNSGIFSLNNLIYIAGGKDILNVYNDVYSFDGTTWNHVSSMTSKRHSLKTVEYNKNIYVIGGYDGTNYLSSTEKSIDGIQWNNSDNLNTNRSNFCSVVF